MIEFNSLICCGVVELDAISYSKSPIDIFINIIDDYYCDPGIDEAEIKHYAENVVDDKFSAAHAIFTQASRTRKKSGYGFNLARYVEKNNLGTVIASAPAKNPNTGNYIVTFVWTINHKELVRYLTKLFKETYYAD